LELCVGRVGLLRGEAHKGESKSDAREDRSHSVTSTRSPSKPGAATAQLGLFLPAVDRGTRNPYPTRVSRHVRSCAMRPAWSSCRAVRLPQLKH
jgi:hypothetical protein